MKTYKMFQLLSDKKVKDILAWVHKENKEIFNVFLKETALKMNVRAVFVQKKSTENKVIWLMRMLRMKIFTSNSYKIINAWLLKAKLDMIKAFLDVLEIKYNEEGFIEDDLPEELDYDKLKFATDKILEDNDVEDVKIYLHTFQYQKDDGWESITKLISEKTELQLVKSDKLSEKKEKTQKDGDKKEKAKSVEKENKTSKKEEASKNESPKNEAPKTDDNKKSKPSTKATTSKVAKKSSEIKEEVKKTSTVK